MYTHYSRIQIYKFSNDLKAIIKHIEHDLHVHFGLSYICIIFILILTFISFLTSSTGEIKAQLNFEDDDDEEEEEEEEEKEEEDDRKNDQNPILIQAYETERFVPSEPIRFTRQTHV